MDLKSRWNAAIWLVPSSRTNSHFHWSELLIAQRRLGPAVGTRESYGVAVSFQCETGRYYWRVLTSSTRFSCWSAIIGAISSGGSGDTFFAMEQMRGLSGGPSIVAGQSFN